MTSQPQLLPFLREIERNLPSLSDFNLNHRIILNIFKRKGMQNIVLLKILNLNSLILPCCEKHIFILNKFPKKFVVFWKHDYL